MRILFITQYFTPENFRGNELAFELAKDNDVHVVCGTPNYPQGRFYESYGWFKRTRETINGVKVTRLPIIPRGKSSVMMVLNYFSYMMVSWVYILFHALFNKYDCVIVQQLSPVMISVPGILYKRLRKVPLYTWVLDLWPESLTAGAGITNKYILKFFSLFAAREYKWSDKILISSNRFRNHINEYGDYDDKIYYFPQWAEDVFHADISNASLPDIPEGFKIMFAGNIGETQDFESILQSALLCKDKTDIKWLIVGDGRKFQYVKDFVATHSLQETVFLYGRYPVDIMPAFFKQADIMLVTLNKSLISTLTAPAKIQAYMCGGKPILAMLDGEGADLIKTADCGYVVPSGDYTGLADIVEVVSQLSCEQLKALGHNGYMFYKENFLKSVCMERFRNLIINV